MIGLVYSSVDIASKNAVEYLMREHSFYEKGGGKVACFTDGKIMIYKVDDELVRTDVTDSLGLDVVCFASRHRSAAGRPAFTTHSLGNWSLDARLGGVPSTLSVAAPAAMLSIMVNFSKSETDVEKTYEATHHGPLTSTPSLFAEFGGDDKTIQSVDMARAFADRLYDALLDFADGKTKHSKIAIGIGGTHYPSKFSRLAIEKGYAFGHIMPRHAIFNGDSTDNIEMLGQAVEKNGAQVDTAVIEWKSISAPVRERVIKKLGEVGIEYERI